jgi:hypothetical protein
MPLTLHEYLWRVSNDEEKEKGLTVSDGYSMSGLQLDVAVII